LRLTIDDGNGINFQFDNFNVVVSINGNESNIITNRTSFSVSSSVRWKIIYGAEMPYLIGLYNPTNTLEINNLGFELVDVGMHSFGAEGELLSNPTNNATEVSQLEVYPTTLIEDNNGRYSNGGDDLDNSFILNWRCGTSENGMNPNSLYNQNIESDTYSVNVIIELIAE